MYSTQPNSEKDNEDPPSSNNIVDNEQSNKRGEGMEKSSPENTAESLVSNLGFQSLSALFPKDRVGRYSRSSKDSMDTLQDDGTKSETESTTSQQIIATEPDKAWLNRNEHKSSTTSNDGSFLATERPDIHGDMISRMRSSFEAPPPSNSSAHAQSGTEDQQPGSSANNTSNVESGTIDRVDTPEPSSNRPVVREFKARPSKDDIVDMHYRAAKKVPSEPISESDDVSLAGSNAGSQAQSTESSHKKRAFRKLVVGELERRDFPKKSLAPQPGSPTPPWNIARPVESSKGSEMSSPTSDSVWGAVSSKRTSRSATSNADAKQSDPSPQAQAPTERQDSPVLTHLTSTGEAHMVDVTEKASTHRVATAHCYVKFSNAEPFRLISENGHKKGDVLGVARIAGIMAAKRCSDIIPLCHPIPISKVTVDLQLVQPGRHNKIYPNNPYGLVYLEATVHCHGPTGVEMEALSAVMGAALTVYDMCKAVDRKMFINKTEVVLKEGGKSGTHVSHAWAKTKEYEASMSQLRATQKAAGNKTS